MADREMSAFVFCVLYILFFTAFVGSIPIDLQGTETAVETIIPIDPSLVSGFTTYEDYTKSNFTGGVYEYTLNSKDWLAGHTATTLSLAHKVKWLGVIWLGRLDVCEFVSSEGTNRGNALAFTEIDLDATDGSVRYSLQLTSGSAGYFVVYWNETKYANATAAWGNSELYIVHGVGIDDDGITNAGAMLLAVLTLSIPDVPPLLGLLAAGPMWVSIIYVIWFFFVNTTPFLGGG